MLIIFFHSFYIVLINFILRFNYLYHLYHPIYSKLGNKVFLDKNFVTGNIVRCQNKKNKMKFIG